MEKQIIKFYENINKRAKNNKFGKRIKELNVFLKRETDGEKVKKLHEEISKFRERIKILKNENNQ